MLNYEDFLSEVLAGTQKAFTYQIKIDSVSQTNVRGEVLCIKGPGTDMELRVSLNGLYNQYGENHSTIEQIIAEIHRSYKDDQYLLEYRTGNLSFKQITNRISCKLIGMKNNLNNLKDIPHREFLDMAVVYYLMLSERHSEMTSIQITNDLLKYWQITEPELWEQAMQNLPLLSPPMIRPMQAVTFEIMNGYPMPEEDEKALGPDYMYVLQSENKIQGAVQILRNELLGDFTRKQDCDILILPCSIHEVILLPVRGGEWPSKEELLGYVTTVNATEVAENEVLSDQVYVYRRSHGLVEIYQ